MVEMTALYEGELHCRLVHGPSGAEIITDAPADNNGKAQYFSPTDLIGAAVGSCVLTVMGIVAERHGIDLKGAKCVMLKEMVSAPVRRVGLIRVDCAMPAGIDPAKRTMLEKTAHACPVKQSLHPDVKIELNFRYPD